MASSGRAYPSHNVYFISGAAGVWSAMPAAATEFLGSAFRRVYADLSGMSTYRLGASMSAAAVSGAVIRLQYTTDLTGVGGWTTVDATGDLALPTSGTTVNSAATYTVPAAAQGVVLLRLQGQLGDAVANPSFVEVVAIFR